MTAPLDEKARDAALAAWFANTAQGWHAAMEAAIRAYLAASPSPSEMEVVAWQQMPGGERVNLVRQTDAQSALAAKDAEAKKWWLKCCETQQDLNAAETQVQRLAEENEALRERK